MLPAVVKYIYVAHDRDQSVLTSCEHNNEPLGFINVKNLSSSRATIRFLTRALFDVQAVSLN
jgi:hypothetical protein